MAEFLKAFESIDTDFSGEITREELQAYCLKQNFDEKFVQKWLNLFDADNSGTITINEYCDTLGLRPNEEYMEQVLVQRAKAEPAMESDPMAGVTIIAVDKTMTEDLLHKIVQLGREAQVNFLLEKDIAKYIKCKLDELDQSAWQVIVGRFKYGTHFTHENGYMLHFFVNRFAILAWRTPNY